jgi:hypothetical protein
LIGCEKRRGEEAGGRGEDDDDDVIVNGSFLLAPCHRCAEKRKNG